MRQRTTRDTWQIHVNYGQGWEHECTEFSRKDAREQLKTYRENAPEYPVRAVKKREPIDKTDEHVRRDVFESHQRRDPHCTCTDCIAEHASRLEGGSDGEVQPVSGV